MQKSMNPTISALDHNELNLTIKKQEAGKIYTQRLKNTFISNTKFNEFISREFKKLFQTE